MVKGKQYECLLQQEINSNMQWELMLENDGLTVVDVYSEWCGPCAAMKSCLRKIKHRLNEYTLNFAVAKSDNIKYLEIFRDRSEPTWLFIAGRQIVNIMYGANSPKLMQLIIEEIKKEIAVKAGIRERADLQITDLPEEIIYEEESVEELPEINEVKSEMDLDEEYIYRPF
ncbi:hypothetical protein ILUMI_13444 [Ignelater luminosus]|uniref:Thioredoxin domain-containing protein n=1 Tax=Ignelater luminosus TaxID=2038154 RepID=A0A8K0CXS5_IGNLU|nr:hypothetical protein ILUMI_13444 [Ignelater luminosus]